jgi:hypothetical protein
LIRKHRSWVLLLWLDNCSRRGIDVGRSTLTGGVFLLDRNRGARTVLDICGTTGSRQGVGKVRPRHLLWGGEVVHQHTLCITREVASVWLLADCSGGGGRGGEVS